MDITNAVDRLHQPEYTGENRCTPCTAVNLLIAAVVAGAVTALVPWFGVVAFVLFAGIIVLRGYLVPGTPTLTKRYFPARVLGLFGKSTPFDGRTVRNAKSGTANSEIESGGTLPAAGIVNRNGTDIDLTPAFREEWRKRIYDRREQTPRAEEIRGMFDANSVSQHGDQSFVLDGKKSVRWESNAALLADVAAAGILEECVDGWAAFDRDRRRSVLSGLRLCLERCPSCDGSVDVIEDSVDPCCQKPHLVAESVCRGCGTPLADAAVVENGEDESVRLRLLRV
jgi:hypothetical protein